MNQVTGCQEGKFSDQQVKMKPHLKVERNIQDAEFLDIKINSDRRFVVVGEDLVSESVDQARFADCDVPDEDALCYPQLWSGCHDISITEFTDGSVKAVLAIW